MQRYIEQLIEDIRHAAADAPASPFENQEISDEEALEIELEESEKFVSGPFEPLGHIVGISQSLLPAPERLSEAQVLLLVSELEKLLNAYNFYPEYPEGVPAPMIYKAFYNIWDDDYVYLSMGQSHIEFCDYDEDNCPFPGYCNLCQENEMEDEIIPPNEFNINANNLLPDETNVDDNFKQIEKEYYKQSEMTDEEGFIPGIHNYCDRWCEKCDFTDKCRVFALETELRELFEKEDNEEEKDTDEVSDLLPGELLPEEGDDDDFEIEFEDELDGHFEDETDDFFSPNKKAARHPMIEMAKDYSMNSLKWFEHRDGELAKNFTAQLAQGNADELMEAEEIMMWYHLLIFTKLKRALSGYYETDEFEGADYDMNGSAKVALLGIDRSIEAATLLMRHLKKHRDKIKVFRDQLEQIRNMAEELFPDARSFIRPGLDEI